MLLPIISDQTTGARDKRGRSKLPVKPTIETGKWLIIVGLYLCVCMCTISVTRVDCRWMVWMKWSQLFSVQSPLLPQPNSTDSRPHVHSYKTVKSDSHWWIDCHFASDSLCANYLRLCFNLSARWSSVRLCCWWGMWVCEWVGRSKFRSRQRCSCLNGLGKNENENPFFWRKILKYTHTHIK